MKIAFLGNFAIDYCSENHYAQTLEAMGHKVVKLQEKKTPTDIILKEALDAEIFVWVHTHGCSSPGNLTMAQVLQCLKGRTPSVAYHLDLYMGISRWKEYEKSEYFNNIDYFFTVDKLMADWLNKNTSTKGVFLPAGVYDKECYIAPQNISHDVIFTGSYDYHPEHKWRRDMIDWLYKTYPTFERIGNAGTDNPNAKVYRGRELNQLYADTKIVVGDTLCVGFDYPYYLSDRIFETTGRGGFILHPYIKGIEKYFELDKEIVTFKFGDYKGLKEKIDYYLTHPEEREKIRRAGHARTKKNHTYKNRWKEIINHVRKNS